MPDRRSSRVVTPKNGLALVAFSLVVVAMALVMGASGNRRASTATVSERERRNPLATAATAMPLRQGEPAAAAKDAAVPRQKAPRTVSEEQAKIAAAALRSFPLVQNPLAEPIRVLALANDPEAAQYANQLARVVEAGGWAATVAETRANYRDVMCLVDNAAQHPIHARVLTLAFQQAGIRCISANKDAPPSNRIEIIVGSNFAE
jgi:hypothetical protein